MTINEFVKSMKATFGEVEYKATSPAGEIFTSKGWKEPTAKKEFEAKPYVLVGGKI